MRQSLFHFGFAFAWDEGKDHSGIERGFDNYIDAADDEKRISQRHHSHTAMSVAPLVIKRHKISHVGHPPLSLLCASPRLHVLRV